MMASLGAYKIEEVGEGRKKIRLLGSGPILRNVREAASELLSEHGISSRFGPLPPMGNFAGKVLSMKDQDA